MTNYTDADAAAEWVIRHIHSERNWPWVADIAWQCLREKTLEVTRAYQSLRADGVNADLLAALKAAVKIAGEAEREWDAAPEGMRAGKILIALAGHRKGYRVDIDAIHAAIRAREQAPPVT